MKGGLIILVAYYLVFLILSVSGVILFWNIKKENKVDIRIKKNRYDKIKDFVSERLNDKELTQTLKKSGLTFTSAQYQIPRYIIFTIIILMIHISYITQMDSYPFNSIILVIVLFAVSSPKEYFLGHKTPFKLTMDVLMKNHKYKMDLELYKAISQLKNLSIIKQNNPPGAIFIIEQINKFTNITKPIFNRLIAYWSKGQKKEGCEYFRKAIDTPVGNELANYLLKLDELNPIELKEQLILYQETVRRRRETEKERKNEKRSNLIYVFVVISSLMVILNFVIVAYYIEQMELLQFIN